MSTPYSSTPGIPHGSRIVTLDSTAYIADNFTPIYPTKFSGQNDQNGRPARFMLKDDFATATAQLQLETDATPIPANGQECDPEPNDLVARWVVESVSPPEEAEGIRIVNVTFRGVPLSAA